MYYIYMFIESIRTFLSICLFLHIFIKEKNSVNLIRSYLCLLQTILASQGHAIRDADNNATRFTITQRCDARSFLFVAVYRTSHMPLDCLTAQNRPGR